MVSILPDRYLPFPQVNLGVGGILLLAFTSELANTKEMEHHFHRRAGLVLEWLAFSLAV